MRFDDYYRGLTPEAKQFFADRAYTTRRYIENWLLCPLVRRKVPRDMDKLISATEGKCTQDEVLSHFYPKKSEFKNSAA